MVRIALLSRIGPELGEIHSLLQLTTGVRIQVFTSLQDTETGLRAFDPQILLIQFTHLGESQVEVVQKMRRRFPILALVVIAHEIDDAARFRLTRLENFVFLNFLHELRDLPQVIQRLSAAPVAFPRAHARARRNDKVGIQDSQGRRYEGRFEDFGRMGAKLCVAEHSFRDGERVLIEYASSSNEAQRKIEAVVVWQNTSHAWAGGLFGACELGVKFIAYL